MSVQSMKGLFNRIEQREYSDLEIALIDIADFAQKDGRFGWVCNCCL